MDALTVFGLGLQLLSNHWAEIVTFGGLVWKIWFDKKNQYDVEQAKKQAFAMATDAVKQMAKEEFDNKTKRDTAVKFVYEALPENARKALPEQFVELAVEQAWQVIKNQL